MRTLIEITKTRMEHMMQTLNFKQCFLTFLLALMATSTFASDNITMFLGEIKIIEVGAIDRVAVGKGGLLSTTMLDRKSVV